MMVALPEKQSYKSISWFTEKIRFSNKKSLEKFTFVTFTIDAVFFGPGKPSPEWPLVAQPGSWHPCLCVYLTNQIPEFG